MKCFCCRECGAPLKHFLTLPVIGEPQRDIYCDECGSLYVEKKDGTFEERLAAWLEIEE